MKFIENPGFRTFLLHVLTLKCGIFIQRDLIVILSIKYSSTNTFITLEVVNTFYKSIVTAGQINSDWLEYGAGGNYTRTSERLT